MNNDRPQNKPDKRMNREIKIELSYIYRCFLTQQIKHCKNIF